MLRVSFILWLIVVTGGVPWNFARAEQKARAKSADADICPLSMAKLSGRRFTNGELLATILSLQNQARPTLFSKPLLREIAGLAELSDGEKVNDPAVLKRALTHLRDELGPTEFMQLVGEGTRSSALAVELGVTEPWSSLPRNVSEETDLRDMNRGFGYQLLRENDKTFDDPVYLGRLLASRKAGAPGYPDDAVDALRVFQQAWAQISPETQVIDLSITGSDAINQVLPFLLRETQRKHPDATDVQLLVFDGSYVGMKGRAAELHHQAFRGTLSTYERKPLKLTEDGPILESPVTVSLEPSPEEVTRLKEIEDRVILSLERKIGAAPKTKPVGGILLEPILGAGGVMYYRSEFLQRLRTLCDRHGVAIVADEILTGGGRTGKFFAYQHYPDFQPDLVTFGKGLIVAGIAQVGRGSSPNRRQFRFDSALRFGFNGYGTTVFGQPETLLKSAQVLKRIHDDKLMDNATTMGKYLLKKLPENPKASIFDRPRGTGLLLFSPDYIDGIEDAQHRLMPYLDITKQEIDALPLGR